MAICDQKLDLLEDYNRATKEFATLCGLLLRATPPDDFDPDKFMEIFRETAVARLKAHDAKLALALYREEHGC